MTQDRRELGSRLHEVFSGSSEDSEVGGRFKESHQNQLFFPPRPSALPSPLPARTFLPRGARRWPPRRAMDGDGDCDKKPPSDPSAIRLVQPSAVR